MRGLAQPGHHSDPILHFSQDPHPTNPSVQGSSVYPPSRDYLFLLTEQSLAYFVQIASSSLFDESLDA